MPSGATSSLGWAYSLEAISYEIQYDLLGGPSSGLDLHLKIVRNENLQMAHAILVMRDTDRILAMGPARRLAGISKREFLDELGKRKIERHYTAEEFEEDLGFAKGGL